MNKKIEIYTQFLLYSFLLYCALTVGSSWDEIFNMTRGSERLKYLFSLGSYESYFYYSDKEEFYPGLYDTLAIFITKMFPKKYEIDIWHLINSLFSLSCIFGIYKISGTLFNKQAGKIIFLLCFFNPIFFGHMAMNPKDTIIAFANIWSTYIFLMYLQNQNSSNKRKHYVLLAGLTIGLGTGVRIPFLMTLMPLLLFAVVDIFFTKKITNSKFSINKFILDFIFVLLIAYSLTVFAWPHVHGNIFTEPFKLLLIQLKSSFGIPWILFDGNFYETDKLPYFYILKNFFYKTPEYILLCYIAFVCIVVINKKFFTSTFHFFWYKILLITFIFLFPTIYFVFLPYRVYDGLRLFLYLIPYFNIIPGLVIYYFLSNKNRLISKISLLTLSGLFLYFLFIFVLLTPYQYTYLNKFNGNFSNAHKKFENDYWSISTKELVSKISNNINLFPKGKKIKITFCGAPSSLIKNDLNNIKNLKYEENNLYNKDFEYVIMTNRLVGEKENNLLKNVKTCFEKFEGKDLISIERNGLMLSTLRKKVAEN